MYSPKTLCDISQLYSLFDDLKNKYEDRSKNGVVGSIGINAPIIPKHNEINPIIMKIYFRIIVSPLQACTVSISMLYPERVIIKHYFGFFPLGLFLYP